MIRLVVVLFLGLCSVAQAQGPILPGPGLPVASAPAGVAFDASASNSRSGGAGNLTWTHTPVGTPTGVAVGVTSFNNCSISGVTYGALSLTQSQNTLTQSNYIALFSGASPPSGAQTVTVTLVGSNCFVGAGSISVTGGNTTTAVRASNFAQGTSASPSVSVTSVSGDLIIDWMGSINTSISQIGAGGTQSIRIANVGGGGNRSSSSTDTATGVSSTMSWTLSTSSQWGIAAASFQP